MTLEVQDNTYIFHGRAMKNTETKNALLAPLRMQVWEYGIVLTLLPIPEQMNALNQQIGNARVVRNRYLDDRNRYYHGHHQILTPAVYKKEYLPALKEELPYLKLSDKFALEAAIEHIDEGFKRAYSSKAAGFPHFASAQKPNGSQYTTKYTNNNIRVCTGEDGVSRLQLPKVGRVRFVLPKGMSAADIVPVNTRILSVSVKRATGDRYTASLQLEAVIPKIEQLMSIPYERVCAVDLGLKVFGVFGNEQQTDIVENPRWIRKHERRLRRFQKSLSRKKYDRQAHKGSKNWEKARARVAKEQRKTADQRKDFHHKLSRKIADRYDVFICEDLNIRGMIRNRHLSKSISCVGWGQFLAFVGYKLRRKGGYIRKVDRYLPSSQNCSCCGYIYRKVKDLSVREWICPACGTYHDRDINARDNILREGIKLLREEGIKVTDAPLTKSA